MSDIFQEVEEDLRRERLRRLWDRFGIYVIALAVLIVAITAGYRGYQAWETSRAQAAGDTFAVLLQDAESAAGDSTAEALLGFAEEAPAGYAMLARFRAATAYEQQDDHANARETLQSLATDGNVDVLYQDIARVRLAHVLLDAGEPAAAQQTVASLAENTANPFHRSAQEMMGLAAYASGDIAGARRWFETLRDGAGTPPRLQGRATFMLSLIDQTAPSPGDTDDAASQSADEPAATESADETSASEETN